MQALLDTAPPPSSAPKPGETKDGARPKAAQALTPGRERFIPVSRYGLRAKLLAMLAASGGDRKTWQRALDCLAAWRHQEHRKRLLDLIEDYQPFSPDSDTANLIELDAKGRDTARREFIASMEMLLARANFVRLSRDDVQRLLIEQSPYGLNLKVDLSEFDEALLYYRGTGVTVREERNPWRLYLAKDRLEIPIFERLFLLLKLKPDDARIAEIMATSGADRARAARSLHRARAHLPLGVSSDHIYVKMFKRIPQIDIEMLFPNTKIAFRPFDKLKLAVTAGGGTAAGVAGTATKLLAATNPFTLALALAGLSAVIFRQVMGFFNTRNRYMMLLAQNLYFCSLANNRGALTLIADGAEEEDVKEDMLLFAFLAKSPSRRGALPEIKGSITSFLKESCGVAVNFDAEDALGRLLADGLVSADAQGNLTAIAPDQARAHLDRLWDRLLDVDTLDKEAAPAGE
ncbi:MAG: TMEM143 family protein [Methyloceanibacter sp.]|jgi:hypothetical protein|nr:TMEM143 family protein [Methyloceanibacter sp.]